MSRLGRVVSPGAAPRAERPGRLAAPRAEPSGRLATLATMLGLDAAPTMTVAVVMGGGGDAFWICVPGSLLVAGLSRSWRLAAIRGLAIVVAALIVRLSSADPLPPLGLAVAVPAASLALFVVMRARLERDREALRHSALTDALTGIANRRALLERIEYEIARHARARHTFVLVMIDLDGFKTVNDRFGHPTGDRLLREAAAGLRATIRCQDTAARIGGDEFCVLAPETGPAGIAQLEARVLNAVARAAVGLAASAGSATFPADGQSAAELLAAADDRLLEVKRGRPRSVRQRRAA